MNKTKVCTKCKVEYPITSEYWHKDKRSICGFSYQCKNCRNEHSRQYSKENKEKVRERQRQWKKENKEHIKRYYQDNKEKILVDNRQRHQEKKELYRKTIKRYREKNRAKFNLWDNKREARKQELPCTLTIQEWKETKKTFNNSCAYCGMTREEHRQEYNQRLHQDHFIPLSKGGGYTKENIIPACRSCNTSKNNEDFEEWYPQQEYYSKEREQKILDYMGGLNE